MNIREQGKIKFSEYFKILKDGENVAIVSESMIPHNHPKRIIGKSGKIIGSRGRSKIVEIKDGNATKQHIVHPVHLRRLKQ